MCFDILSRTREMVETKKMSYHWIRDKRLKFNVSRCTTMYHEHQILPIFFFLTYG
jgi:hypothetical protein